MQNVVNIIQHRVILKKYAWVNNADTFKMTTHMVLIAVNKSNTKFKLTNPNSLQ